MGLKFFDLFAGIGGFRLGMERAGHTCVGSCEWDDYARETYKKNFGSYPEYDDAKDLHAQSLPSFDVLCAGFPCQAFSIAGKRLGFEDTRGTIFFEIARIAKEKRPSYLLLENVRGLLSHDKGRTFATIISTLDALGYDAEWQVLNSKYFVPQNRERVFIIGHLRGERTRQIFPLGDFNSETDKPKLKQIGNVDTKGHNSLWGRVYDPNGIAPNLNANGGGMGAKTGLYGIVNDSIKAVSIENTGANGRRIKDPGDPQFCLSQNCGVGIQDNTRIRRLTPVECERLQGFPDGWTIGSDTQRYKQCGNAVTVHVVEYIARELRL
jgi:DNA (cytosine-5)-methyltransferase 1